MLRAQHQLMEWRPRTRFRRSPVARSGVPWEHADGIRGRGWCRRSAAPGHAWHARVMPDEVSATRSAKVSIPSTASGSPPTGRSRSVAQRRIQTATATRPLWCGFIAATVRTKRWTVEGSPASIEHWSTSASPATTGSDGCCTTTSPERRRYLTKRPRLSRGLLLGSACGSYRIVALGN